MFIIVETPTRRIVDITNQATQTDQGIQTKDALYVQPEGLELHRVTTIPKEVAPYKYLFIDGEFVLDENYRPEEPTEQRVARLEDEVRELRALLQQVLN